MAFFDFIQLIFNSHDTVEPGRHDTKWLKLAKHSRIRSYTIKLKNTIVWCILELDGITKAEAELANAYLADKGIECWNTRLEKMNETIIIWIASTGELSDDFQIENFHNNRRFIALVWIYIDIHIEWIHKKIASSQSLQYFR